MKKALIVMRGIPGAGKTSAAGLLAYAGNYSVFSADDYFYENGPNPGKYDFDASQLGHAHAQCKMLTELALKNREDIVFVANTFTTEKEIKPYKDLADRHDYMFISLIVENRHGNSSIHGVPVSKLEEMKARFSIKL